MDFYKTIKDKLNKISKGLNGKDSSDKEEKPKGTKQSKSKSKSRRKAKPAKKNKYLKKPSKSLVENLVTLKKLVSQPKEKAPDKRFYSVNKNINEETINETIKQERWSTSLYCPECESTNVTKIMDAPGKANKYKCNSCGHVFSDSTGAPFDGSSIPLQTWIECWYLFGLTTSMEYIAHKLDLDVHVVRLMIQQLQKIFKVEQPLTKLLSKDNEDDSFYLKEIVAQIKAKQDEILGGPAVTQAKDLNEHRKMKDRQEEESGFKQRGRPKPKF